jgi:hypothetical protein
MLKSCCLLPFVLVIVFFTVTSGGIVYTILERI